MAQHGTYIAVGVQRLSAEKFSKLACEARRYVILMAAYDPGIHLGSSLSVLDIVLTLYATGRVQFLDGRPGRNVLVLSKGHAVHAVYAVAAAMGLLSLDELRRTGSLGSPLENHPEMGTPLLPVPNSGSLGHGISMAVGLALGYRLRGWRGRIYLITGDGELDEGQSWEAFQAAAHYNLNNLITIVDYNSMQLDGESSRVLSKGDLARRFEALGFSTTVIDGHDYGQIIEALESAESSTKPHVIIARTVRNRGVPGLEGSPRQRLSRDEALEILASIRCDE